MTTDAAPDLGRGRHLLMYVEALPGMCVVVSLGQRALDRVSSSRAGTRNPPVGQVDASSRSGRRSSR